MDSLSSLKEIDNIEIANSVTLDIQNQSRNQKYKLINQLTVITQNIRSIYKNFDDLQVTLSRLTYDFDVLILTECRLHITKPVPYLTNYTSYQTQNLLNQNDGIVIYVHNKHKVLTSELRLSNASGLQLIMKKFAILGIYRSPSHLDACNFTDSLDEHLNSMSNYKNIYILGDINIDIITTPKETSQERRNRLHYLNVLSTHGLLPGHTLSTRDDSCLDHVFLKIDNIHNAASVSVLNTTVTDHNLLILNIAQSYKQSKIYKYKTVTNYEAAYSTLVSMDVTSLGAYKDPNIFANALIEKVRSVLLSNSKQIVISSCKIALKPWITPGIIRCIRLRNNMQMKLKNESHNLILKITFRRFRNFCSNLIRKQKILYNKNKIKKSVKNPSKLWPVINEVTQYKPSKIPNTDLLHIMPSPQASINNVNHFFINIGKKLAENILNIAPARKNIYVTCNHPSSFVLLDATLQEVDDVLMSLDWLASQMLLSAPLSHLYSRVETERKSIITGLYQF